MSGCFAVQRGRGCSRDKGGRKAAEEEGGCRVRKMRGRGKRKREETGEGKVGVASFAVVSLENSFRICARLIARPHTRARRLRLRYMAITMVTKCTEHNRGGIFLSFKGEETTIGTTKGGKGGKGE